MTPQLAADLLAQLFIAGMFLGIVAALLAE